MHVNDHLTGVNVPTKVLSTYTSNRIADDHTIATLFDVPAPTRLPRLSFMVPATVRLPVIVPLPDFLIYLLS